MNLNYHIILSRYFASKPLYLDEPTQKKPNTRKLVELPWQQTKGEMWDEVTETLCNLDFIQAKASARMTYELVDDYNAVLKIIPENAENIREEKARQELMDKYTRDLILFAKGKKTVIEIPESFPIWTDEQITTEIERIKTNANRVDRLKEFKYFLGEEANNLQNFAYEMAHFANQQAWNFVASGPVGANAEKTCIVDVNPMILRSQSTRPGWIPHHFKLFNLQQHLHCVDSVSITPDGTKAVSASWDCSCILWDLTTGKVIRTLTGHDSAVKAISITPDARLAISGSVDRTCILWDLISGEIIHILKGHKHQVQTVSITPDGRKAISGSADDTCILWDLSLGKALHIFEGHAYGINSVSITPDGKWALSGSVDSTCILWHLPTLKAYLTLKGHTDAVNAISVTPDGKKAISGSKDGTCIFWDLTTGEAMHILKGHKHFVLSVTITSDGKKAVSGSEDHTCILWDLQKGSALQILKGHSFGVNDVSITPDGARLISGSEDGICFVWDLTKGSSNEYGQRHTSWINSISVTPDKKMALSGSDDQTCILWDLFSGEVLQSLKGHTDQVRSVCISSDGRKAVSGSDDSTCILWDLITGKKLQTLRGHTSDVKSVFITPDGNRAISISTNNGSILWDLTTGKKLQILNGYSKVLITPNGRLAIGTSKDGNFILWDLVTGEIQTLKNHSQSNEERSIEIKVLLTPDGKRAIFVSGTSTVELWDLSRGEFLRNLKWQNDTITFSRISPDGRSVFLGTQYNTYVFWDLKCDEVRQTIKDRFNPIIKKSDSENRIHETGYRTSESSCILNLDGKRALSYSWDGSCSLWDLERGTKLAGTVVSSAIETAAFFPSGIILGCRSGEFLNLRVDKKILCPSRPIVTIRQIWDFELKRYLDLSVDCPLCGIRFAPNVSLINTIENIEKKAGLGSEQSPCLELPEEFWAGPGLIDICPKCGEELKFNPFIVNEPALEKGLNCDEILKKAERAYKYESWNDAYELFNKLIEIDKFKKFNISDLRFKMAKCLIKKLTYNNIEIINRIFDLTKLLEEQNEWEKGDQVSALLIERLNSIREWKNESEKNEKLVNSQNIQFAGSNNETYILLNPEIKHITRELINEKIIIKKQSHSFAVSLDGRLIFTKGGEQSYYLWDFENRQIIKELWTWDKFNYLFAIDMSTDGKYGIASCMNFWVLWNLNTGKGLVGENTLLLKKRSINALNLTNLRSFEKAERTIYHSKYITDISFSPDNKNILTGSMDNTAILWDLESCLPIMHFTGHNDSVETVAIGPDGRYGLSCSRDGSCILWDFTSGNIIKKLSGHNGSISTIAISNDGKIAILGSHGGTCILWNLKSAESLHFSKGHCSGIESIAITPNGKFALTSSQDNTCALWDLKIGKPISKYYFPLHYRSQIRYSAKGFVISNVGCNENEIIYIRPPEKLLLAAPSFTTIHRKWDFELHRYLERSADCLLCGHRFAPPASVIDTIEKITLDAGLKPEQSPCLELPDKYWEEPGLLSNCPNCGEGLKFNPFFVGPGIFDYDLEKKTVLNNYKEPYKPIENTTSSKVVNSEPSQKSKQSKDIQFQYQETLDNIDLLMNESKWSEAESWLKKLLFAGHIEPEINYKLAICILNSEKEMSQLNKGRLISIISTLKGSDQAELALKIETEIAVITKKGTGTGWKFWKK